MEKHCAGLPGWPDGQHWTLSMNLMMLSQCGIQHLRPYPNKNVNPMKRISLHILVLIVGAVVFLMNTFSGFVLTAYNLFNMCLNDVIIVFTTVLIYFAVKSRLKTAFRISLPVIFSVCGIIQFVAGLFSPSGITDNYVLIGIFILAIIEFLILLLVHNITEPRRNM